MTRHIALLALVVGCGGGSRGKATPPPAPDAKLSQSELELLKSQPLRIQARIVSTGVYPAELEVTVLLARTNRLRFEARGTFGERTINLRYTSDGNHTSLGGPTPPGLDRAVIIGLTRMGLLHNVAVLMGARDPDHAVGGVEQWVRALDVRAAPAGISPAANQTTLRFGIEVAGKRSGTADVWLSDDTAFPEGRVQSVTFAAGTMKVKESYQIETGVTVTDNDFRSAGSCLQDIACLERACAAGDLVGCERAAVALYFGAGVTKDVAKARRLWSRACKEGHAAACEQQTWATTKKPTTDPGGSPAMMRLARAACDAGVSCAWIARRLKWDKGGRDLVERACHRGMIRECLLMGSVLEQGRYGGSPDATAALVYYRRACTKRKEGCTNAVRVLLALKRRPEAATLALELCKKGRFARWSCRQAGTHLAAKDSRRPLVFSMGCKADDGVSCASLAAAHEKGAGVRKDIKLALELHRRACQALVPSSCMRAAALDRARAAEYWGKGCEAQHRPACWAAGEANRLGRGVKKNAKRAIEYYATGCLEQDYHACFVRARMLERGSPKDTIGAKMKYDALCGDKGSHQACVAAARLTPKGKARKATIADLCQKACNAWKARDKNDRRISKRSPALAPVCRRAIKRCK